MARDVDAENHLRTSVLEFMDTVRTVERAIAADRRGEDVPEELDIASLGVITEEEWRAFWPSAETVEDVEAVEPVEERRRKTSPSSPNRNRSPRSSRRNFSAETCAHCEESPEKSQ